MMAYKTRDTLKRHVIEAFAAQDEVYRICFFGREAEGQHDAYSDIDMIVYSQDPAKTQAHYRQVFTTISPIRANFPLGGSPEGCSEMVMLRDYSPYQKIDFSIGDWGKEDWLLLTMYERPEPPLPPSTTLEALDIRQDVAYKLMDVLFSIARFTKCLFRHDIDMYRRWESITDLTLVVLYEKYFGWQTETLKRRLGSYESKQLDTVLDSGDREWIHKIRPPGADLNLAQSYQDSIALFIRLSRQKATHFGIALDDDFIAYMVDFMDTEMARYHEEKNG
jgi:predicted nucleotidyltransferase